MGDGDPDWQGCGINKARSPFTSYLSFHLGLDTLQTLLAWKSASSVRVRDA
jgi:hypothetical protein